MKFYEHMTNCPRCNGEFDKSHTDYFQCTNCDFKFFLNPIAANGVILENENGEILLVERNREPHKGMLDVPGGFLSLNESAEESAAREIKEELHLTIAPKDFEYLYGEFGTYSYQEDIIPIMNLVFRAKLPTDQIPQSDDDAGEIHYFKPQDIPLEKIGIDGIRKALQIYKDSH